MKRHLTTFRFIFGLAPIVALMFIALTPGMAQRTPSRTGFYEAEGLFNSGKVSVRGGSAAIQRMSGFGTGWSGDAHLFWAGGETGAALYLTIDIGEEGIFEVELHMTRAPDFGRLRIQVDGKNAAEVFDGYAPTVVPSGAIKLGTFDLQPGPRNMSFTIEGKNESSINYFAGIDFLRLKKIPTAAAQKQAALEPDSPPASWSITSFSVTPEPTVPGPQGNLAYLEAQSVWVKCSYKLAQPGQGTAGVLLFDTVGGSFFPKTTEDKEILKYAWVNQPGELQFFYALKSAGYQHHRIGCLAWVDPGPGKTAETSSVEFVDVYIVQGIVPKETKWPTAPIVKVNAGKMIVTPFNAASSHCANGSTFWFEWRYHDEIWGSSWKPLKMMSKPLACMPDGSVKDISGMKPGLYQVRAQERNGKYNFTSDWSEWVWFKIPSK